MTAVNMSGSFKKDQREYNGLEAIAEVLVGEPLTRHVVVGIVETIRTTRNIADGGSETATVRFVHIEAIGGADEEQARAMLAKAFKDRTGRTDEVQPTLFDGVPAAQNDPAAGPWPGDPDYRGAPDEDASGALKPVGGTTTTTKGKAKT